MKSLDPAGPLYRKGLRVDDVVTAIRWPADREDQTENRPAAILEKLRTLPWMTQVVFEISRGGAARPPFQLLPAWQPLATLFVSTGGEWAFWTPEGYYDSSINGYHLFGWQVNRGLQALPDFYRADQFYKKLERPDVIDRLLPAGSLREAFRQAKAAPPKTELHEVLPAQIAATPRVRILSPASGVTVEGNSTLVKAVVMVPADRKLVRAKVFANGVVATDQKQLGERDVAGGKEVTLRVESPLAQGRAEPDPSHRGHRCADGRLQRRAGRAVRFRANTPAAALSGRAGNQQVRRPGHSAAVLLRCGRRGRGRRNCNRHRRGFTRSTRT